MSQQHPSRVEMSRMDQVRPTLGANCTIVCGHTIGKYAFIGAGAVVTRDVPDHALVVGNPAKQIGWMCVCGTALKFKEDKAICSYCERQHALVGAGMKVKS